MTKFKKIARWIIACFVGLVVLLTALTLVANRIIKQERTLAKIQAGASQAVGGQVELHKLKLTFFPWPNIVIQQASFSIPDSASGTMASLALYPRLLPLLTGQFLCSRIDVKAPDIKIQLPEKQAPKDKKPKPFSLEDVKANVGAFLSLISEKAPGLYITVKNGRLNLLKANNTGFEVKDIQARIDLPPDTVNFNIECKSGRWERIFLKGSLHSAEDQSALTFAQLKLDPHSINLSGKLEINHPSQAPSPSFALEIKGKDVDVDSARKVALDLVGDTPVAQDIFEILKGGRVPFITFTSHGNSLEDLGKLDRINIQGRMLDGKIFVPEVNLDLTHVNGDVIIAKGILQGNNLEARWQNSQGRQGTLKLGLKGEDVPFHLDVTIDGDLARLPAILTSLVDNDSFVKEVALVKNLQGKATGRLILGERLSSIETHVEVTQFSLSANYQRLPYILNMQGVQFSYKDDKVFLKNASGRVGQSSFSGLAVELDFKKSPYLEVKAGQSTLLMDEIYPWLSSYNALKAKLQKLKPVKGVLSLAALSLQGPVLAPEQWHLQTAGDLALEQGLNISTDITVKPDAFSINKLVIQDRESHASVKLDYKNRALKLFYNGNLNKTTLDNLIKENQILGSWIKGDFHTHLLLDKPINSTARGNLRVKDLIVPWKKNTPLTVNNLALEAKEDNLLIVSASLSLAGDRFDLNGNVNFSANELNFDMDLSANTLNIDKLKQALGKKQKTKHDQVSQRDKTLPVRGHIKLKTQQVTYAGLTWNPFYADITIKDDTATVAVTEANLCGIATPGNLKISPREISLDVKPAVKNRRLYSTIHCLFDKSVKVDGNFTFNGNITAQGADKDMLGAINGDFRFTAGKGRFYSGQFYGILVGIVRLLSITEIFRGKLPDIGREGFGYNSIKAEADIKNGKIRFNEMIIDGMSMTIAVRGGYDITNEFINCVALVSPLKTIDAIFKKIPLVKDIVGGSLVTIAYSIKGHPDDPKITRLSPSEVDSELLGIMQKTIQLPVKIIQPVIPEGKKK